MEREICYDRVTRDYRATLDGELVGYYPSYHAAEGALDALVYDLLRADGAADTSDANPFAGVDPAEARAAAIAAREAAVNTARIPRGAWAINDEQGATQ